MSSRGIIEGELALERVRQEEAGRESPGNKPLVCYVVRLAGGVPRMLGLLWMNGYDSRKLATVIAAKRFRLSQAEVEMCVWEIATRQEQRDAVAAETRALISLL